MIRNVETEKGGISYELQRKAIKNLNLRVRSDGTVKVSVPYNVSYAAADSFVKKNTDFILKAKKRLSEKNNKILDSVYYLGNALPLEIKYSDSSFCDLKNNVFYIYIEQTADNENVGPLIKNTLKKWQLAQSAQIFPQILEKAYKRFLDVGLKVPFPTLAIRTMKTRWGSCTAAKKKVCLNASLMEKPVSCIEYVACHELAHFIVQNHSKDFYRILDTVMPEHKTLKKILNGHQP